MTVSGKELCGTAAALTEKELEQDLFALTRHVIYGVAPWLRPCCQVKVHDQTQIAYANQARIHCRPGKARALLHVKFSLYWMAAILNFRVKMRSYD